MSNSSKDPQIMLNNALDRGYHRILFQQGEPVLDRELTLLGDLASPERLANSYLGDGVPANDNGFAIMNLNVRQNDFAVAAGRCLVGGREVRLAANTTYRNQPHTPSAEPLPTGRIGVYLHVFTKEVTATEDPDLANTGDVGIETSVREKVDWEIQLSAIADEPSSTSPRIRSRTIGARASRWELSVMRSTTQGATRSVWQAVWVLASRRTEISWRDLSAGSNWPTALFLRRPLLTVRYQSVSSKRKASLGGYRSPSQLLPP
jgi:hypothetical protein